MPFVAEQSKADDVVITLTIKVLVAQDAFLLKTLRLVEFDGAFVVGQRLPADFVKLELHESMDEGCAAKLAPAAFGRTWGRIETPVGNAAIVSLVEVDEPKRLMVHFKNQQVLFRVWQSKFKPALMFI